MELTIKGHALLAYECTSFASLGQATAPSFLFKQMHVFKWEADLSGSRVEVRFGDL